jgi:hypothetical protein
MDPLIVKQVLAFFTVELLVIFGNQDQDARDIDVLIVSDDFKGISLFKSKQLLKRIDSRLDPVCLSLEQFGQFKQSDSSLYKAIIKTHSIIWTSNKFSLIK